MNTIQGNSKDPIARVVEIGLYQNVYKSRGGEIVIGSRVFETPEDAEKLIKWDDAMFEYLYTAKMTSWIHKFDKP